MVQENEIRTLRSLFDVMENTRTARAGIVRDLLAGPPGAPMPVDELKAALTALRRCAGGDEGQADLVLEGTATIRVDLFYEISELEKDITYLEKGEGPFLQYLASRHADFDAHVQAGVACLEGKRFNCFITDRDGTINNYCARYRTAIQSVYNAVFLSRFARRATVNPMIITSAPLKNPGIVDVSTLPENTMILAASKGREFIDLSGRRRSFPIEPEKQRLIDRLNRTLKQWVRNPAHEQFALIGSGLQFKFGQTTIARQDINGAIPADQSASFLQRIGELVREIDPTGENFIIEDTGLDVEIILTVADGNAGLKDFDKKEAVRFLNRELGLDMANGPHLVCGDTGSDLPMLEAAMEMSADTWSIFVTRDAGLAERVKTICPHARVVPEPDMLITILNQLAMR